MHRPRTGFFTPQELLNFLKQNRETNRAALVKRDLLGVVNLPDDQPIQLSADGLVLKVRNGGLASAKTRQATATNSGGSIRCGIPIACME